MNRTSYGHTDEYDHYALVMIDGEGNKRVRYSRYSRLLPAGGEWDYFAECVSEMDSNLTLDELIEDFNHVHPAIYVKGVKLPSDIDAHMP